jgi:hypothetical protein
MKPPIIFLDFDDVIALNTIYGGYDVISPGAKPADLYSKLFHPPAVELLLHVVKVHKPLVVITTSWLRFLERDGMEQLLRKTAMVAIANALHDAWEAPALRGMSRLEQIDVWLAHHHNGEPYVVLDDFLSGTGLLKSSHDRTKRVVFCEEGIGLHEGHLAQINAALTTPGKKLG